MSDKNNNHDPSLDDIYSKIRKDKDIEKKEKTTVPFKFLDSYTLEDKDIFFGRDNEIEEIYRKFYKDKILLVYGKSGTGKSSVINCGLMSKIPKQDIYTINVRCGKAAYKNFITELKKHSQEDTDDSAMLVEDIFFKCFKPVAIIFDQFEESFILSDKKERQKLVQELKKLLESELNINLVFIIREEYYANLTEFEENIPEIWSNRIRIEKMDKATVTDAIEKPCEICNVGIEEGLPEKVVEQLTKQSATLELTWLQVIMDKLYKMAVEKDEANPVIKHEYLKKLGRMGNVLSDFLDEQLQLMPNGKYGEAVLKTMISTDGTKKQVKLDDISQTLQTTGFILDKSAIEEILRHFVNVRIITDRDEQGYYELRHDGIAARIFERMSAIEKELMEVKTFIENSYKNYEKRKVLLSDNDLKYIALYESKLFLNKKVKDFIQTSKKEVQKAKRRRRNIVVVATVFAFIILSGFTIWALNEREKANLEKLIAQSNHLILQAEIIAETDPTIALRLAEHAIELNKNKNTTNTLYKIYRENNFYKIIVKGEKFEALSPDGRSILTSSDNIIHLWDLSGNLLAEFIGPSRNIISSGEFSPDGKNIVTGCYWDSTAYLLDLSGNLIQVFKSNSFINSVKFSPDGQTILTESNGGILQLWNLAGKLLNIIKVDVIKIEMFKDYLSYPNLNPRFSPDGLNILTHFYDGTTNYANLYDLKGNLLHIFKGPGEGIILIEFSPDSKYIITTLEDHSIYLWDYSANLIQVFKGHEDKIFSVTFSNDSKLMLSISLDKTGRLWDLEGNVIQILQEHDAKIMSAIFSSDCRYILTRGSNDRTVRLWDLDGNLLQIFKRNLNMVPLTLFNNDESVLTADYSSVCAWNFSGNLLQNYKGHEHFISSIISSPEGKNILTTSYDNTARIWDLSGNLLAELIGHSDAITSADFSHDGKNIITGSWDNTACLWDLSGNLLQEFKGHDKEILSVAFSPDGKNILTGSMDETAILWDLDGSIVQKFIGQKNFVFLVGFAPNGKKIYTASYWSIVIGQYEISQPGGCNIIMWDFKGNILKTFDNLGDIESVAFSPDGQKILTLSKDDNVIRIWSVEGDLLNVLQSSGTRAIFSPDGLNILVNSPDNLKLLDLEGNVIQEFDGHKYNISSASFTSDSKIILTGSGDGIIRFWDIKMSLEEFQKTQNYEKLYTSLKIDYGIMDIEDIIASDSTEELHEGALFYYKEAKEEIDIKIIKEYLYNSKKLYEKIIKQNKKAIYFTELFDVLYTIQQQVGGNNKITKKLHNIFNDLLLLEDVDELAEGAYYFYGKTENEIDSLDVLFYINAIKLFEKIIENHPESDVKDRAFTCYNNLSLAQLFTGQFEDALNNAKKGLDLEDAELINTKLALAYIFNDQYNEAKTIIEEHKNNEVAGTTFQEYILKKLTELEKAGITHPDVEKVRELLKE